MTGGERRERAGGGERPGGRRRASAPGRAAIDADRTVALDSPLAALRRRLDGRYAVDELGTDPHLIDVVAAIAAPVRVRVEHAERLPEVGPALLVANRGSGVVEPVVLVLAVRRTVGRRLRVLAAPDLPLLGPTAAKLGAIGSRPEDAAALLRAGGLAVALLAPTRSTSGADDPQGSLLRATLGFPVIPVAVRAGGPLRLPLRPWRVAVGAPLLPPAGADRDGSSTATDLATAARDAVRDLLVAA